MGTTDETDWRRDQDVLTSVAATPERVGLWAVVDGTLYYAGGTDSADDWVRLANPWLLAEKQDTDPDGTADFVTLFAKETRGILQLWYRRGTGDPVQLTGVEGTEIQSATSPNWDSGWCAIQAGFTYALNGTSLVGSPVAFYGGLSSTTKGGTGSAEAGYGVTPATANFDSVFIPTEDCWGFRILACEDSQGMERGSISYEYIMTRFGQVCRCQRLQKLRHRFTTVLVDGDSTLKLRLDRSMWLCCLR
jgi:hypothetical protein